MNTSAPPELARPPELAGENELDYLRLRQFPLPGQGLEFDETYRYAHLPLVAPAHPDVIAQHPERGYVMGRHANVRSLVVPVAWAALSAAPAFQELMAVMQAGPLADVIAWPVMEQRKERLHATICGNLPLDDALPAQARATLAALGPIRIDLRGLFSGNLNTGRLYLRLYPEKRGGVNVLHAVQDIVQRPRSGLYVVGLFNLTDRLTPAQGDWLAGLLRSWWTRSILQLDVSALWLLDARDDLVLDGEIVERVPLQSL